MEATQKVSMAMVDLDGCAVARTPIRVQSQGMHLGELRMSLVTRRRQHFWRGRTDSKHDVMCHSSQDYCLLRRRNCDIESICRDTALRTRISKWRRWHVPPSDVEQAEDHWLSHITIYSKKRKKHSTWRLLLSVPFASWEMSTPTCGAPMARLF